MDPLLPDDKGRCPLHEAIRRNDKAAIEAWLQQGMKVDGRLRPDEPTPLQMAIEAKNFELVTLFTVYGADLLMKTEGRNAYHYAATATPGIMEYLLQQPARAGAEAMYTEKSRQWSPLRIALHEGDRRMTEVLLDYGIDVNERNDNGETALYFLMGNRGSRETALPLVRLLIDRGADIGAKAANYWDETPLFAAVQDQFTDAVRLLLDLGCDAKEKNHQGDTLLHAAALTWDAKTVQMLLDHGAVLEEMNRIGRTALHIAAHANRLEVVKTLLAAGADPFAGDRKGQTPDDLCPADFQKNVHREIIRKQMELEAKHMTHPHRTRDLPRDLHHRPARPQVKNRSSRHWENGR